VTLEEAAAELTVIGARIAADRPATHGQLRPRTASYARAGIDANEPGLARLMSMARVLIGIVLLVVAVNVGTLVYARDAARVEEVAVRTALGAGRSRIVLQMFLEALVLASLAAAVGLAIMAWPLHLLREVFDIALAQGMAFWFDVRLGPTTILLVAALVLVSAVLTGIPAALKLTRGTSSVLQRAHAGASGLRFGRAATVVIVSQVAISVALLTVGASQLRTFVDEWASLTESGIDQGQYLTAQLRWDLAGQGAGAPGVPAAEAVRRRETWRALGRRIGGEPDVRGVTFDVFGGVRPFVPIGAAPAPLTGESFSYVVSIAPNYFDVNQTPIRTGRTFDTLDAAEETRRVAIVNEAFVRTLLPAGQPLGQRIHPVDARSGRRASESLEIVGVVGDLPLLEISQRGAGWVARPTVYVPLRPTSLPIRLTVRAQGDPAQVVGRLHAMAAGIDPTLVVHQPMPLDDFNHIDRLFVRLYGFGAGFLVVAVLVLSTAGVYSMLAFTVSQRTREIGIRTALGANPGRVVAEVFSRAFVQLGSGTLLGLTIGFAASAGPFALSEGLFDKGPGVVIAIAAIILLTGLVACGMPLRRALRIQPTEALRMD
jgi:predicted permease